MIEEDLDREHREGGEEEEEEEGGGQEEVDLINWRSCSCPFPPLTYLTHPFPLQVPLSITNSQSLLKFMSIELVMPCNHLILCCPILPLPSTFPSSRVFSNESALHIR